MKQLGVKVLTLRGGYEMKEWKNYIIAAILVVVVLPICLGLAISGAIIYALDHTAAIQGPCSNPSPCTAILSNSGNVVAKTNTIKPCGQDCVEYKQLYSGKWVKYTGGYTTEWVGPGTPGMQGNI